MSADSIYWGYCACECGCREATGPWPDRSAAASGICGSCDEHCCLRTSHVGARTQMRRKAGER
jgi:hypothetical protein